MNEASLIIATLALVVALIPLVWLLAKEFSSHSISYIDPFAGKDPEIANKVGHKLFSEFRDLEHFAGDEDLPNSKLNKTKI